MIKEYLEALEELKDTEVLFKSRNTVYMGGEKSNSFTHKDTIGNYFKGIFENLENALTELQSIKEANPSEALEILLKAKQVCDVSCIEMCNNCQKKSAYNSIKQALLKVQENVRSEEILQKYYQEGITLDSVRELKKENELLKEIIKSLFDKGCPLHQYTDKDFGLTIEVDNECSTMHLGEFKGVDLDKKLKEVLDNE